MLSFLTTSKIRRNPILSLEVSLDSQHHERGLYAFIVANNTRHATFFILLNLIYLAYSYTAPQALILASIFVMLSPATVVYIYVIYHLSFM